MSIESINERELLSSAMQGSQIAYRELIHLHQNAVYRFAWALIGDEKAQLITENAFLTAWRQLDYFKTFHMSFRDRLFQLVCIDCTELSKHELRHRINFPAKDGDSLNFAFAPMRYDPRTNMEHLALQTDIEEALHALPCRFRQILLLHEMGDWADTQIADVLGDTAQNVHADLMRARGFLRRQIFLNGGFFPLASATEGDTGKQLRACKENLPMLAAAADDLCTTAEKQALSAHFETCQGCRDYYESLRAIHHGIAVMKRETPGDMAAYIIGQIQKENGGGDLSPQKDKRRGYHFRPAIGRFTIIGLCLALILLAYSSRLTKDVEDVPQQPTDSQSQTVPETPETPEPPAPVTPPAEPEVPAEPEGEHDGTVDPETPIDPETGLPVEPEAPPTEPEPPEGDPSTIIPGGDSSSSTLIPEGETYAALYTAGPEANDLLIQYCAFSFRSTMTDGTKLLYYVVPVVNQEPLSAAFTEAAISAVPYDEPTAIDPAAESVLYIVTLS